MNWDDLRFFLAVHRTGSLAAAGRTLSVTHTTVGRRLAALEKTLGLSLFERTPDGLRPTEAGDALLPAAQEMERGVESLARAARGLDGLEAPPLRVATSDTLATHVLLPRLAEVRRSHPDLRVDLRVGQGLVSLARREADLAVRARPRGETPGEADVVARKLADVGFALFASKAYLRRHRIEAGAPLDLSRHELLGHGKGDRWAPGQDWLRARLGGEPSYVLRTGSLPVLAAAAGEGLGLAVLPDYLGAADPRLMRVSEAVDWTEIWLAVHRDLRRAAPVRWILEALTAPEAPPAHAARTRRRRPLPA